MEQYPKDSPSLKKHRTESLWQIVVPAALVSILLLVTGWLVIAAESSENRLWADAAVTWLVAPLLVLALVFLVALGGLIYLLARLTAGIPRHSRKAQEFARKVNLGTRRAAEISIKPVLFIRQAVDFLRRMTSFLSR